MIRRPLLLVTSLWLFCHAAFSAETARLNFISIVTDDQAAWALGCYGNKECLTPNMDRLAKEGARFANAFTVTPVCSPSRAIFISGKLGTQLGITDWIAPNEQAAGVGLSGKASTWPKVLQSNAYATALFGKWHLGDKPDMHPTKQGFDFFYGFLGGGTSPMNPTYDLAAGPTNLKGYGADLMTDEALRWVGKHKEKPFSISLHYREPHSPYGPVPEEDSRLFEKLDPTVPESKGLDVPQVKKWTREYYASIHSVDRNLGRLFAYLEKEGLWDKTIIQFTSDHGYNIGQHGIHTKGNGMWIAGGISGPKRPNMWDTSLRIPLIVRWPGVVKAGTVIEQLVQNLDNYASVLGMLGLTAPVDWVTEGKNYAPLLRGEQVAWREETYGQYDLHNSGLSYMRMIRTAKWKYVRHFHENLMDELYDLEYDPDEAKNLIGKQGKDGKTSTVVQDLNLKLEAWMKSVNDPLLKEPRLRGWMEVGDED